MQSNSTTLAGALGVFMYGCIGTTTQPAGDLGRNTNTSVTDGGADDTAVDSESVRGDAAVGPGRGGSLTDDGSSPAPVDPTGDAALVQQPPAPPTVVQDCASLPAEGVFEKISPPGDPSTFAIGVDPVNQGTIYVGTVQKGLWKSTDCGANWARIATGRNGDVINSGMNWTFAVDPIEPNVVYTNSGYGSGVAGLYKSVNGGVDWDLVWPPAGQPELGMAFEYNFANVVALNPENHKHMLLTFHEPCRAPHAATCIAETLDGGDSWRLHDGQPGWSGNEGQVIFFMGSARDWLWGSQSNGFWQSANAGQSWVQIAGMNTSHYQGSQLARDSAGNWYMAGAEGVWRNTDGASTSWKLIDGTGPIAGGLLSTGTNIYANNCFMSGFCTDAKYFKAADASGDKWSPMTGPKISVGGTLGYDKSHKLLYGSHFESGLWRAVLP